jgi:excisionase family DNA binding protein
MWDDWGVPRGRQKTLRELGEIPEWLTPGQAAELLQVHPQTVRVWIKQGRIPSQTFGASSRIPRDELFAKRPGATPKPPAPRPAAIAAVEEEASLEGEIVTISNAQAAQILGVSRATIERWVRAGRFTMVAIGANKGKRRIIHDQRFDLLAAERSTR